MQIVSNTDNLHEVSDPVYWKKQTKKKQKNISLSSAELVQRVVKVKIM